MDCGESIGNKKYSIVKFLIDNSYSEIPTSWLILDGNKQKCLWPPRTANAASLIANCTSPNLETWNQYEIDLIKHCTSLESARKSAADSNYETTDEDKLGRGQRQHILYTRYSSEEEENNNCVPPSSKTNNKRKTISISKAVSALPSCPDNLTFNIRDNNEVKRMKKDVIRNIPLSQSYCEKKKTSHAKSEETQICDMPIILDGEFNCVSLFEEMQEQEVEEQEMQDVQKIQEDSNIKKYFKQVIHTQEQIIRTQGQIIRTQATSNLILRDVKQLINRMEDVMRSRAPLATKGNDSLIAEILPLRTVETIRDFDSLLHNTDEAVTQFREFLLKIGGNNPRDNIHRTLSRIFTNECAINCSWKGIRKNFKISNLYFIKIMRRDITLQHSTLTETEFDNIVAEWLRFAKQRKQREEKGIERGEINKENN